MKTRTALILTSNSARHLYFANIISNQFDMAGIISEPKSDYFLKQREESGLVREHFTQLELHEKKYLGEYDDFPNCPTLLIQKEQINEAATLDWAFEKRADVVFLFGTGILGESWLSAFKERIINLHLGYSPRYRGAATLFWPFVHDELEYVGATIHLAEPSIDGGPILQIITPKLEADDNYYDINFKTVKGAIDRMGGVVASYLDGSLCVEKQDSSAQKYQYRKSDFNANVLAKVLDRYGI